MITVEREEPERLVLTFGGLGAAVEVAVETDVQGAAETLILKDGEGIQTGTGLVVEAATLLYHAALDAAVSTFTGKALLDAWWWREPASRTRVHTRAHARAQTPRRGAPT